ncbi:hypothetical protein [Burkholderia sp. AW49-1]
MQKIQSKHFLIFSFPLPKTIKYIYASFEQADKPSSRMTAILRNGDTPSFRPAAWYGQPRGLSVQGECTPAQGRAAPCRAREINSVQHAPGHFEPAS